MEIVMEDEMIKRVFFAMETHAPWPEKLPKGRILAESDRHMTLAFLGEIDYSTLQKQLDNFPKPEFQIGFTGIFDKCLFLPERHPHVVAWHLNLLNQKAPLLKFQSELVRWLRHNDYVIKEHENFLPHITVARSPFVAHEWKKAFSPVPGFTSKIHLYESLGSLQYKPCWSYELLAPIEELDHTADIGYLVRGENILQLLQNASIALAFQFPSILPYFTEIKNIEDLDDIIIYLNKAVTKADEIIGCPFKAVSYHGSVKQEREGVLNWEMVIDV